MHFHTTSPHLRFATIPSFVLFPFRELNETLEIFLTSHETVFTHDLSSFFYIQRLFTPAGFRTTQSFQMQVVHIANYRGGQTVGRRVTKTHIKKEAFDVNSFEMTEVCVNCDGAGGVCMI